MAGILNLEFDKGSTFERVFGIKKPSVKATVTTSNGSATLSNIYRTDILEVGMLIIGDNIPSGTTILSIDNSTIVTMSENATASASIEVIFKPSGYMDLTTLDFRGQIRKTVDDNTVQTSFNFLKQTTTTVKMSLTSTQTSLLSGNNFVYDIEMFTAGDSYVTKVLKGTIVANDEVTR